MELFKANKQWSTRPKDERFSTLQSVYDATRKYAVESVQSTVNSMDLRAQADNGEVVLIGKTNVPAKLTNWAFGQLAARAIAPAGYLRTLSATLAVQNINHGLAKRTVDNEEDTARLLIHRNGELVCRAITSERYARIWNYEVVERLLNLESLGWTPAVPDFNTFGDSEPSLYASDHDMFCFMRSDSDIVEPGSDRPLYRGVIVENSEVGASALKLTRFYYRAMCGNHIIWGASKVIDLSVRHIGDARERWTRFSIEARAWAEESTSDETPMIEHARTTVIAGTKEDVLDAVFGKRVTGLSKSVINAGYDAVIPAEDGDPKTVWGLVQGITRHSQTLGFADERTVIDRAAGKLLEVAF